MRVKGTVFKGTSSEDVLEEWQLSFWDCQFGIKADPAMVNVIRLEGIEV